MISLEKLQSIVYGYAVADACGVPVEFCPRSLLKLNPVKNMREFGTWNQPAGTWSDDTSLTLATMESIARLQTIDYADIMKNFLQWYFLSKFTANNETFDCGATTFLALRNFANQTSPLLCGLSDEKSNGNGSLMRILPVAVYFYSLYGDLNKDAINVIHNISSLTHAHPRSLIACGIYSFIAVQLLKGLSLHDAIFSGIDNAKNFYSNQPKFIQQLDHYSRLFDKNFAALPEYEIESTGYVVSTLEAVVWCLLKTDNYKSLVLKAVNLGGDTDTVSAIAGGLAGIAYGLQDIPKDWLATLKNKTCLEKITEDFFTTLTDLS